MTVSVAEPLAAHTEPSIRAVNLIVIRPDEQHGWIDMSRIRPKEDLTDRVFGDLTVIERLGARRWLVKCEGGNERVLTTSRS